MPMQTRYREVPYEVANPEWERLDDLLLLVRGYAPDLRESLDAPARSGPVALVSEKADEIFATVSALRSRCVSAADGIVEAVRAKRDEQSPTLSRTRTESYQVWVDDPARW